MTLTMQQWIFVESYGRYTLDLGDSNVELADITTVPGFAEITTVPLGYGHQAGLPELRAAIAARYHNVDPADVLVCTVPKRHSPFWSAASKSPIAAKR